MNLRKTLSVVLSVALLISALSVISIPFANAAATYTDTVLNSSSQTNLLITPENNIFNPAVNANVDYSGKVQNAPSGSMYDGVVCPVNATYSTEVPTWNDWSGWSTVSLGDTYDVDRIMVGGCTANYGNYEVKIYVGDADHSAVSANESAYELTATWTNALADGGKGHLITFDKPVRGSKIVFYFGGKPDGDNTGRIWVTELAATGAKPYTVTEITKAENADKAILGEENILKRATVSSDGYQNNKSLDLLVDGTACGVTTDGYNTAQCWEGAHAADAPVYITYVLDGEYMIDSLYLNGSGNGTHGADGFKVYVNKAYADITADDQPVYAHTATVAMGLRVDFAEPVKASVLTFALNAKKNGSNYQIWMSELAATGEEVVPPYTVTDITRGNNEDKIIAPEDNILKNATTTDTYSNSDPKAILYDGILPGVTAGYEWNDAYGWVPYGTPMYLTYDLGAEYDVDSLLMAGSGTGAYGLTQTKIYIGDKAGFAAAADEPVYATTDNIVYGRHVALDTPVRGRYIVFAITGKATNNANNGRMWISELAATGTKYVPPYSVYDITDGVNEDKIIAAEDNILKNAAVSSTSGVAPVALMYDGKLAGVTDGYAWTDGGWQAYGDTSDGTRKVYITWDLGSNYEVDRFLLAGSGAANTKYGANNFTVYVGDKTGAEIKADPSVAEPVYASGDLVLFGRCVQLDEPAVGRYIVFEMVGFDPGNGTANNGCLWLTEFAAAGVSLATYTVTDITDGVNEDKIISAEDNILNGATATTVNASSAPSAVVTDGLLTGVTVDYSNSTCWAPTSGDPYVMYITYDLGNKYAVDSLLYAGSGVSTSSANDKYGPRGATIYVGDKTGAEIKADPSVAEPVYSTTDFVLYGRRIDLKEAAEGRYIVFAINCKADTLGGGSRGQVWISELAATGTAIEPEKPDNVVKVVTVGDSITCGVVFPNLDNWNTAILPNNYPKLVVDKLNAQDDGKIYELTNLAISGSAVVGNDVIGTTGTGDTATSWYNQSKSKICYADVLTIMLGTNDAGFNWTNLRKDLYKDIYRQIVADFRAKNPDLKLYVLTSPNSFKAPYKENLANDIVKMQKELAEELGATVIDVYSITRTKMIRDGEASFIDGNDITKGVRVHPGEAGHALMADIVYAGITGTELPEYIRTMSSKTLGGQVRDGANDLRFGFDLIADGVAYADANPAASGNYARDLSAATVNVEGKAYALKDFGAVVSVNADSELVVNAEDELVKTVSATNLYAVAEGKATYTAVVTGIPEAYTDTAIYARPYFIYNDGEKDVVVYGDVISRTLNQCAADALG